MSVLIPDMKWFYCTYFPAHRVETAAHMDSGILPRLAKTDVTLFTPWGPRYRLERGSIIKAGDPELATLNHTAETWRELRSGMDRRWRWVLLGADTYGLINGLDPDHVNAYFASLRQWVGEILPEAEFRLWSEFDQEAAPLRLMVDAHQREFLKPELVARAERTAQRGGFGNHNVYLRERIAEAWLAEARWSPIKYSLAPKGKDDGVDGPLPRLYMTPHNLQTPWMK